MIQLQSGRELEKVETETSSRRLKMASRWTLSFALFAILYMLARVLLDSIRGA